MGKEYWFMAMDGERKIACWCTDSGREIDKERLEEDNYFETERECCLVNSIMLSPKRSSFSTKDKVKDHKRRKKKLINPLW